MSSAIPERERRAAPPPSPITGGTTTKVDSLDFAIIVSRYADAGVDVTRYYAGLDEVPIFRCTDTGYRFFHPRSLAGEADFYDQLYLPSDDGWIDPDYREWSEDYQFAFDRIDTGERLLDIGCGYGYFLRRAQVKADVQGLDGNPHAVERCRTLGLTADKGQIQDYADTWRNRFDTVCLFQVLEHIYDVRSFIDAACAVVKPGGRIIVAVPNNEPYIRRYDTYNTWNLPPHHIGLWNLPSLRKLACSCDLEFEEYDYSEVSGRWFVEAYLHAARLAGVTTTIHHHSPAELARMALRMPWTLPISVAHHLQTGGRGTRNVVAVVLRKPA